MVGRAAVMCVIMSVALVGRAAVMCVIMSVALVGNFLVALVFYKNHRIRTNVNCFIVIMALSDLLFPIFLGPRMLVENFTSGRWLVSGLLGNFLCKFVFFLQEISTAD